MGCWHFVGCNSQGVPPGHYIGALGLLFVGRSGWVCVVDDGKAGQGAQSQTWFRLKLKRQELQEVRNTRDSCQAWWLLMWLLVTYTQWLQFLLTPHQGLGAGIQLFWYYSPTWYIFLMKNSHVWFWSCICVMSLECFANQLVFEKWDFWGYHTK